jgi:hypothetical protein
VQRALANHIESGDVTRVIYGTIIGLAIVVALEAHPPTITQTIAAIAGPAVAVGLAEIYSDVIGAEARTREPIHWPDVREASLRACAVVFGAGFPVVFFVLAGAGAFTPSTAFTIAEWTGIGLILGYGYIAARLSGSGRPRAVFHACVLAAIGGALILLKSIVH